jgi:hypothetical protein
MLLDSSKQKSESVTGSRPSNNKKRGARDVNNLLAFPGSILINGSCVARATLTHANDRHIWTSA